MSNATATVLTPSRPGPGPVEETELEYISDVIFGIAFLAIAVTAAERYVRWNQHS